MIIICCGYGLCGAMDTLASVLRGIGYSILPTLIILLGVCGFRIVWVILIINGSSFNTPIAIYMSYPISWALTIVIEAILFVHAWRKDIKPGIPAAERLYGANN
jgi:Na+-driven multidrug efflux pump